jgi:hypothetical protein
MSSAASVIGGLEIFRGPRLSWSAIRAHAAGSASGLHPDLSSFS